MILLNLYPFTGTSQVVLLVKNPPVNAGGTRDVDLIPGLGRPPGGGYSNPLQYSCLKIPMDRGTCGAIGHGVTKSRARLKQLHMRAHTSVHQVCWHEWGPAQLGQMAKNLPAGNQVWSLHHGAVWRYDSIHSHTICLRVAPAGEFSFFEGFKDVCSP